MILSLGLSYTGFENWVFAADARYHDFKNTDGFDVLGWSNVFAGAFGAQYQVNDCWHVRAGYNFNQNPIQDSDVLTNIATPLIQDHNISAGTSYRIASNVDVSLAYIYLVNNEVTGPLPAGRFGPDATLSNKINAHSGALGVTVRY
jgi:long-chain fatty acid transport protein